MVIIRVFPVCTGINRITKKYNNQGLIKISENMHKPYLCFYEEMEHLLPFF
jgi:hypothetical protein